ncbi:MAG: sigma 54-interacting transcriptional regulator [Desulfobacterales bacterium]|nr:sigma 54-interacting transcriptional regulator [Desulfobacterales bacterium]
MKKLSDKEFDIQRSKIIGLGEKSARKSYYPELQSRIQQLDKKNKALVEEIERRKKIETFLLESEQLYRILAENIKEGAVIISQDKILFSNPAFRSIFRRDSDALSHLSVVELFDPAYREKFLTYLEAFERGEADRQFTGLCLRGDGKKIWAQGYHHLIDWAGNKAILVTVRDVTEQKEKERKAQAESQKLQQENQLLKSRNMHRYGLGHLVGTSDKMQTVYENIIKAATLESNVIIYGESGTGKELVSKSIHDLSTRRHQPYITVNCGAVPENLFESEFFGHRKGAFSGATIDKFGFFESAHKGTLFLDEIGEIPLNLQVKLLRAIDGGGYTPIGSTKTKHSDVRIIAATNQNLKSLAEKGLVRQDFFFRIHIIPIYLPPLRERKEDIPLLIYHFIRKMSGSPEESIVIPDAIMKEFQSHDWPGNVRELQNAVSRYVAFRTTEFLQDPGNGTPGNAKAAEGEAPIGETGLNALMISYEKRIIEEALDQSGGNITRAAEVLKIGRRSLQRKITRLNIPR